MKHFKLDRHLNCTGVVQNDECRACGEDIEMMEHFLCHCSAFVSLKFQYFRDDTNSSQTSGLKELKEVFTFVWKGNRRYF